MVITSEQIMKVLEDYICRYHVQPDGDGLPLVDVLSNGPDISSGTDEIEALADYLYDELPID